MGPLSVLPRRRFLRGFGTLLSLISGRISSLCSLYGAAPLRVDFRGMTDRARPAAMGDRFD